MRRVVAALAGAAALVALAVAAWPDDDPAPPPSTVPAEVVREAGIPVLGGHTHGPGTALRGGLVVPEGTLLLGEVLPVATVHDVGAAPGPRWLAVLVVTGAPDAVRRDLVAQLPGARHACRTFAPRGEGPEVAVGCAVGAEVSGGSVWAQLTRSPALGPASDGQGEQEPASHLLIRWSEDALAGSPGTEAPGGVPDGPVPGGWADPPAVGERLMRESVSDYVDEEALRLATGTALVGPEIPWSAGSPRFLLHVAGDPAAAVAAYVAQVRAATPAAYPPEPVEVTEVEGRTVHRQLVHIDADGTFLATAVSRPGHPTYLVLDRLHD